MASPKSPPNGLLGTGKSGSRIAPAAAPIIDSTASLRFWTSCLFFAAAVMIVVSVAGFVFLRNLALRQPPSAETAKTSDPKPAAAVIRKDEVDASKVSVAPVPPTAEPVTTKAPAAKPAAAKPAVAAVDAEKPAPLVSEPTKAASNRNGRLLESVGSLCAVQLYQSYLNVGLLADAVEHETYTKADAAQILNTIVTLSQTVDGQLQKLNEAVLDDDDKGALDRVRKASALVRTQAAHLQTFWNSGEKTHIDDYQRVRQQCWQELRSILGLPEEKE